MGVAFEVVYSFINGTHFCVFLHKAIGRFARIFCAPEGVGVARESLSAGDMSDLDTSFGSIGTEGTTGIFGGGHVAPARMHHFYERSGISGSELLCLLDALIQYQQGPVGAGGFAPSVVSPNERLLQLLQVEPDIVALIHRRGTSRSLLDTVVASKDPFGSPPRVTHATHTLSPGGRTTERKVGVRNTTVSRADCSIELMFLNQKAKTCDDLLSQIKAWATEEDVNLDDVVTLQIDGTPVGSLTKDFVGEFSNLSYLFSSGV